jgi:hypothetical protein
MQRNKANPVFRGLPEHYPRGRTTVQFDYADMPSNKASLVGDQRAITGSICPIDPSFEADLYVATTV